MDFSQLHSYTPPECDPDNTGYTYSLSSSYSKAALEFEKENQIDPVYDSPRMSRRSMRLRSDDGHQRDDKAQSYGSSILRTSSETRIHRSKKTQGSSNSITLSLSHCATPKTTHNFAVTSTPINSNYRETDAHQLSSTMDLRQRIITKTTFDEMDHSAVHASSGVNGNTSISESHALRINGGDCFSQSHQTESHVRRSSSRSTSTQAAELDADLVSPSSPSYTSIYTRDRRHKKAGFLGTVSNGCVRYSKQAMTSITSLFTTICSCVYWFGSKVKSQSEKSIHKGTFTSFLDTVRRARSSSVSHLWLLKQSTLNRMLGHRAGGSEGQGTFTSFLDTVRRAQSSSVSHLWLLKQSTLNRMLGHRAGGSEGQAHTSFCGSMNVKELMNQDESHLKLNGSLCDDCKRKQFSQTHSSVHHTTQSSRSHHLVHTLWSSLLRAGNSVNKTLSSSVGSVGHSVISVPWTICAALVNAARGVLWLLATGWYQLVYVFTVLNVFIFTRILPKLWLLLWLILIPLVLWALFGFLTGPSLSPLLLKLLAGWRSTFLPSPTSGPVPVPAPVSEDPIQWSPATPAPQVPPPVTPETVSAVDFERVERIEHQLALLKEHMDKQSLWVSALLEQKIGLLRGELDQENNLRSQEVQQKQQELENKVEKQNEEVTSSGVSVGVVKEQHDTLNAKVQRLELEVGEIRHDLNGVVGCKGRCGQLDTLPEMISSQVTAQMRKELQTLFFGNTGSGEVPESLILWLSQRYVSTPDLQESLMSLEMKILKKISEELEQSRAQGMGEDKVNDQNLIHKVSGVLQHASTCEGMSEEQVNLLVANALRLYSQDRTGLVDYALESGGGSILSTRCSETYETKTALLSMFGLPLWYFSQSPRVVIQPDVHPGNCWAFKGTQGYLVIRLTMLIVPSSFGVEHVPKSLSPTGNITSAPRDFTVYGLNDEDQEEGKLLGQYTYDEDGEALQIFQVQEQNDAFQIIEVRVLSNWGHKDYTCLYRFRVHGTPHQ